MAHLSNKDIITIVFGGLLSALCCALSGNSSVTLFLSFIYVIYALFLPIEQQLFLVALGLPNTKALGLAGISASICICSIAVLKYCITEKNSPPLPAFAILFLIYSMQYAFRCNDLVEGIVMPLKNIFVVLFFLCLASSFRIARKAYAIGLKASLALFVGILSAFWASSMSENYESVTRMAVVGNDPNMLSVEVAFVLSVLCVYYYSNRQITRSLFLISVFVLAVISLFCGSRMGLVLFAFVLFTSVLLNSKRLGRSILLFVVFGAAIVVFLMSSIGQSIIDFLFTRMETLENRGDISNHRFELWETYLKVFNSDPIIWLVGMGDYSKYGINTMAHNALIEDIANYGLIGMFILYSLLFKIFARQYRYSKIFNHVNNRIFFKLPFAVPIIGGLTLHTYTNIMNITMLYIGILCMARPKTDIINIK